MPLIRYEKEGLFSAASYTPSYTTPTVTPTPTPTYTPIPTPTVTPPAPYRPRTPSPTVSPPVIYRPPTPSPTYVTPSAQYQPTPTYYQTPSQGTPSYVPTDSEPEQVIPEEVGLYPPGYIPIYYSTGGSLGPSEEAAEEEQVIEEEPQKTNWLMWIAIIAGAYFLMDFP